MFVTSVSRARARMREEQETVLEKHTGGER